MRGSVNFAAIGSAKPLSKKQWVEQSLQRPNGLICPHESVKLQRQPIKGIKSLLGRVFTPGSASVSVGFVAVRRAKSIDVYAHEQCVDTLAAYGLAAGTIELGSETYGVNIHRDTARFVLAYQQAYGDKRKVITRHEVKLRADETVAAPIVDAVLVARSVDCRPKRSAPKEKVKAVPVIKSVSRVQAAARHHRAPAVTLWPEVPTTDLPIVQAVPVKAQKAKEPVRQRVLS